MTELMRRRRALMGVGGGSPSPVLPDEYQAVSYIQCSYKANNYVLTNVPVKDAERVVIDGSVASSGDSLASLVFYPGSSTRVGYFDNNTYAQSYLCDPAVAKGSSETGTFTFTRSGYATETAPLYLFGGPSGAAGRSRNLAINTAEIYDSNNALKFRAVAVYRKSDNALGLYDFISQSFCPAVGTFAKGADV